MNSEYEDDFHGPLLFNLWIAESLCSSHLCSPGDGAGPGRELSVSSRLHSWSAGHRSAAASGIQRYSTHPQWYFGKHIYCLVIARQQAHQTAQSTSVPLSCKSARGRKQCVFGRSVSNFLFFFFFVCRRYPIQIDCCVKRSLLPSDLNANTLTKVLRKVASFSGECGAPCLIVLIARAFQIDVKVQRTGMHNIQHRQAVSFFSFSLNGNRSGLVSNVSHFRCTKQQEFNGSAETIPCIGTSCPSSRVPSFVLRASKDFKRLDGTETRCGKDSQN